jgi:hypothetical protein
MDETNENKRRKIAGSAEQVKKVVVEPWKPPAKTLEELIEEKERKDDIKEMLKEKGIKRKYRKKIPIAVPIVRAILIQYYSNGNLPIKQNILKIAKNFKRTPEQITEIIFGEVYSHLHDLAKAKATKKQKRNKKNIGSNIL